MMSASEGGGGHGKADIVGEVVWILWYKSMYKSDTNADKGGGGKKIQKFCQHRIWKLPFRKPLIMTDSVPENAFPRRV